MLLLHPETRGPKFVRANGKALSLHCGRLNVCVCVLVAPLFLTTVTLKDVYSLIPRTREYIILHGKSVYACVIKAIDLQTGRLFRLTRVAPT